MIDRTSKVLLAIIALGLWANAGISFLRPAAAIAQIDELSRIRSDVSDLTRIGRGSCSNSKIC